MNIICKYTDRPERQLFDCALALHGMWHNGKRCAVGFIYGYDGHINILIREDDIPLSQADHFFNINPKEPYEVEKAIYEMEKLYTEWSKQDG